MKSYMLWTTIQPYYLIIGSESSPELCDPHTGKTYADGGVETLTHRATG